MSINCMCKTTIDFKVRVGENQGFALSSYLFSVVVNVVMKDIQDELS